MRYFSRRHRAARVEHTAPPPGTPVEVGFKLRVEREVLGLSLDAVREQTGVPRVDLEALEQGQLELLHFEQAAVIALWRYAEVLELEPEPLVEVLRRFWPRPATAVDALVVSQPLGPTNRLRTAEQLFRGIVVPGLASRHEPLGLSASTERSLESRDLSALGTLAAVRAARLPELSATAVAETPSLGAAPGELPPALLETVSPLEQTPLEETSPELAPTGAETAPAALERSGVREPAPATRIPLGPAELDPGREPTSSWSSRVARVIAERFGLDAGDDAETGDVAALDDETSGSH